ncbi:hypothetical protein [Lactococcus kimchii]|uniref:hypothetical protein n=1 Tax=Lactococcus sp. S-13 TaxID=2507158 RepID=UPI0010235A34|nr:hypothetical protein [Lactococcus sp. S-13]RZI49345.1 hypothetical protein EQJ87_07775 [Lactococcus sp. S-13]
MKNYFFELKKFIINKRNASLCVALTFLLLSSLYFVNFQGGYKRENLVNQKISMVEQRISSSKEAESASKNPDKAYYTRENELLQNQLNALKQNNVNSYFNYVLKMNKLDLAKQEKNPEFLGVELSEILKTENQYIQLVQKRKIDFEIEPEIQFFAFGNFVDFTLKQNLFTNLYLIGFILLVSTSLAYFYENREDNYFRFAAISPAKNVISKVFSAVTAVMVWLIGISAFNIIVIGIKNGFGSWRYPSYLVNYWGTDQTNTTPTNMGIPVGETILISFFYIFIMLVFFASIGAFLSVLLKKSMVVIGILSVSVVGWLMVINNPNLQSVRKFVPMSYFNPIELLCKPNYLFGANSLLVGIIYLAGLSILFMALASLLLSKSKVRRI